MQRHSYRFVFSLSLFATTSCVFARQVPPQTPYLVDFATQITESLRKADLKSVVVADFVTPEGADLPQGRFFATQLSLEMQRLSGTLFVADAEQLKGALAAQKLESKDLSVAAFLKPVGKSLAVEAALTGTLDTTADRYILKVSIRRVADGGLAATGMQSFQRSPLLESLGALDSTHRAPSIARAGIDAVSTPVCEYCPSPHFEKNPTNPLKGTIVLSALVSTDGSTTRIKSVKDSDQRLLQPVIVAVSSWRLKPATGKDGKPVAVVMPIEVTFR